MKVETYKPLHRNDVPLDEPEEGANPLAGVPEWADRLLEPVHSQLKDLTRLAQKQVSFVDNLNAELRTVSIRHNVAAEIGLVSLRGKPVGIIPLSWDVSDFARFRHEIVDLKTIRIWVKFDTDPARDVDVTFAVLGG